MQAGIEQNRMRDHERFEANRRFEEMTDIAERLSYPIDTTIQYAMRGGAAYALSDTVERPFHNQTWLALQRAEQEFTGDQAFQRERLRLEHEEALMVDAFGRGDLGANVLIKYSKVPDAIVMGTTSINGYRRDLLRSFVRVYYRTGSGVNCRLFTLDGNHEKGVQHVGQLLGIETTKPSEEVLAATRTLTVEDDIETFVEMLVEQSIATYDQAVLEEKGIHTFAGSRFENRHNALSEVGKQAALVFEHMDAIATIAGRGLDAETSEALLETQRQRVAAAVMLASQGVGVVSSGDSAVSTEMQSSDYGRECASGSIGMNQGQQSMENVWAHGECQVCFARTLVGSCKVCAVCAQADDLGVDLLKLRDSNLRHRKHRKELGQVAQASTISVRRPEIKKATKQDMIRRAYGENVTVQSEVVFGGKRHYVIDKLSKTVIASL